MIQDALQSEVIANEKPLACNKLFMRTLLYIGLKTSIDLECGMSVTS